MRRGDMVIRFYPVKGLTDGLYAKRFEGIFFWSRQGVGEPLEISRVEGEGKDVDVSGVKAARIVSSEFGVYICEAVENA